MKKNLIVDIIATLVYMNAAFPSVSGVALHEWTGLVVAAVFIVHVALHYDWVVRRDADTSGGARALRRWLLALNGAITVAFMAVTVSGLGISGTVLPTLGLYSGGYYLWRPMHSFSAKVLLALLLVHVVLHWNWIAGVLKKGLQNG